MALIDELKRRNVFRVAALYLAASWLLLQVTDLVLDAFEASPEPLRWLIIILVVGFPVALVAAWAYELTPGGLRRDDGTATTSILTRRLANIALVVMIGLAAGLLVLSRQFAPGADNEARGPSAAPPNSIAVLPFTNISDDPADEYFADGLTEELLNLLASIPQLQVTARTSSFAYKGTDVDVRTIGKQLNVAHLLEGSVRKSGNQLRITAQLIDTSDGYHIWSATFDRELDDVFAIQDDVAQRVAGTLQLSVLGDIRPVIRRTSPEAFSSYLTALGLYRQRTDDGYRQAIEEIETTIELDPDYAPAWTLLASTLGNLALSGALDYADAHEQALQAVERALDIDPNYPFAISSRAWIAMSYERDFHSAAQYFRRALELAPGNPVILVNMASLAKNLGRLDRAIELTRQGIVLSPLDSVGYSNLSDQYYHARRPAEAIRAAERALELAPGNETARLNLAAAYIIAENPAAALTAVEAMENEFYREFIRALALHDLARREAADEAFTRLVGDGGDERAVFIAAVHAWRGETEDAFGRINRAISEQSRLLGIRTEPLLASLHADPRWDEVLRAVGLADEQIASIEL